MQEARKVAIVDLNECITCKLCSGYFVDATTIIECLHTFCRSCIVRYLATNKYCPICDVQVHKTKPLLNIRPDKTLQDVVYKLVPRLYQNESRRRKSFYDLHPGVEPSAVEQLGEENYEHILAPEETICIRLNYHESSELPRYLRCPAAVSVFHLQKLLRAKYDLSDYHRVEIMYNQDCLNTNLTLMDVAYIYSWKRKTPLELTYKIYERRAKKPKLEETSNDHPKDAPENLQHQQLNNNFSNNNEISNLNSNNNNWKEVQLRISESGEMSIIEENNSSLLDVLEKNENNIDDVVVSKSNNEPQNSIVTQNNLTSLTKNCSEQENNTVDSQIRDVAKPETNLKEENQKSIVDSSKIDSNTVETTLTVSENDGAKESCVLVSKPEENPPKTTQSETISLPTPKKELPGLKYIGKTTTATAVATYASKKSQKLNHTQPKIPNDLKTVTDVINDVISGGVNCSVPVSLTDGVTTMVFSTINDTKCSTKSSDDTSMHAVKRKMTGDDAVAAVPPKMPKQTILNHSIGLLNLSNNHPLKKHATKLNNIQQKQKLVINRTVAATGEKMAPHASLTTVTTTTTTDVNALNKSLQIVSGANKSNSRPGTPNNKFGSGPCYMPKAGYSPVINVPKVGGLKGAVTTTVGGESSGKVEIPKTSSMPSSLSKTTTTSITTQITNFTSTTIPHQSQSDKSQQKHQQSQPQQNQQPQESQSQKQPNPHTNQNAHQQVIQNQQTQSQTSQKTQCQQQSQPQICQQQEQQQQTQVTSLNNKLLTIKTKPSTPIGYKTLRDPPKSWNSQISQANMNKTAAPNNLKNVRPAKFFKGRNNMPRYLGNPASGVKPMYQVHVSPEKNQNHDNANLNNVKMEKSEIKKHSIVKIDPKTLRPISEKAPEMSNLSNVTSSLSLNNQNNHELRLLNPQELKVNTSLTGDLKINTSSVSIFNPLKLQSSPKSERRSPKSPHSPKVKTALNSTSAANTSTASFVPSPMSPSAPPTTAHHHLNKRLDKSVNQLNFTPPNPFVPNLTSPTLNPNPFLYPTGPAGFPSYDPRVMAAYHSLWYGRGAMAGLGGVMGVPGFDMSAAAAALVSGGGGGGGVGNKGPVSPKMMSGGVQQGQQHSPGVSLKHHATPLQVNIGGSRSQNNMHLPSKSPTPRKNRSEPNSKSEKSLENTVEKLTQNKAKELGLLNHKHFQNPAKTSQKNVKTTPTTLAAKPAISVTTHQSSCGKNKTVSNDSCQSRLLDASSSSQSNEVKSEVKCIDTISRVDSAAQSGIKGSRSDVKTSSDSDKCRVDDNASNVTLVSKKPVIQTEEDSGSAARNSSVSCNKTNKSSGDSKDLSSNGSCKGAPVEGSSCAVSLGGDAMKVATKEG